MKRIRGGSLAALFVGFALLACDNSASEPKTSESKSSYYYEFFRISKTDFDSVAIPSSFNFNTVKAYRNQLKAFSVESIVSGIDATQSDIYGLLTDKGMTPEKANQ